MSDFATYARNCERFQRISVDEAIALITERHFNRLTEELENVSHVSRQLYDGTDVLYIHLIRDNEHNDVLVYISEDDGNRRNKC